MIVHPLDSSDNKIIRTVRRLMTSHTFRDKSGQTVVEGRRVVDEALSAGVSFRHVVYSRRLLQETGGKNLIARLQASSTRLLYVTERLMEEISGVEAPQGVVGVISWTLPEVTSFPLPASGPALLVVAEALQDPGNLGSLIRSAQAAGAHGIGVTKGTVEVFNPKTLRACAGSVFRIPVFRVPLNWMEFAKEQGLAVRATTVTGGQPYDQVDWMAPVIIVLGNEGNGLTLEEEAEPITVPMVPTADSLNVAMAGSVILFHAASQRRLGGISPSPPLMI